MAELKNRIYGLLLKITAPLFAATTFSCVYGPGPAGVPSEGIIEGTIVDSISSAPIPSIEVTLIVNPAAATPDIFVTATDSAGYYSFRMRGYSRGQTPISIRAHDIDGEENGGSYAEDTVNTTVDLYNEEVDLNFALNKQE